MQKAVQGSTEKAGWALNLTCCQSGR